MAQQWLAREVVDALDEGGAEHDRSGAGESAGAFGEADDGGAAQPFVQEQGTQQDAEDRSDGDQEAGGARVDVDLAPIEEELTGGHAGGSAQSDQGQVGVPGQPYVRQGGAQSQRDGRDHQP